MENEVKQRNQRNRRRERAQRMQAQRESKTRDGDSGEDESPAREKPPRPPIRRKKSKEPILEEDIIDGFAIMSFRTYEDLENAIKLASKHNVKHLSALAALTTVLNTERDRDDKPKVDTGQRNPAHILSGHAPTHVLPLSLDAGTSDDSGRASERLTGSSVAPRDPDSSRDRLSDASSRCSSGKGYICDSEGEDDKGSDGGSVVFASTPTAPRKPDFPATGLPPSLPPLGMGPVGLGGSASPVPAPPGPAPPAPSPAPAALPPPTLPPPPYPTPSSIPMQVSNGPVTTHLTPISNNHSASIKPTAPKITAAPNPVMPSAPKNLKISRNDGPNMPQAITHTTHVLTPMLPLTTSHQSLSSLQQNHSTNHSISHTLNHSTNHMLNHNNHTITNHTTNHSIMQNGLPPHTVSNMSNGLPPHSGHSSHPLHPTHPTHPANHMMPTPVTKMTNVLSTLPPAPSLPPVSHSMVPSNHLPQRLNSPPSQQQHAAVSTPPASLPVVVQQPPAAAPAAPPPSTHPPGLDSAAAASGRTNSPAVATSAVLAVAPTTNGNTGNVGPGAYPPGYPAYPQLYAPYAATLHSPYLPPVVPSPAASPRTVDSRVNRSSPMIVAKSVRSITPSAPTSTPMTSVMSITPTTTATTTAPSIRETIPSVRESPAAVVVARGHSPRGHSPTRERDSYSSNVSSLSRSSATPVSAAYSGGGPPPGPSPALPFSTSGPAPSPLAAPVATPVSSSHAFNKAPVWPTSSATSQLSPASTSLPRPTPPPPVSLAHMHPSSHPFSAPLFATPLPPPAVSTSSPHPFSAESLFQSNQADLLRRELDNRFLASQDRGMGVAPPPYMRTEMHHHQHQHTHVHQHQPLLPSAPSAPSSLFPPPLFKEIPKLGSVESPFYRSPGLSVGSYPAYTPGLLHPGLSGPTPFVPPSHLPSFAPKQPNSNAAESSSKPKQVKSGKWNAMHVRIAWEIYHYQTKPDSKTGAPGMTPKPDILRPPSHLFPNAGLVRPHELQPSGFPPSGLPGRPPFESGPPLPSSFLNSPASHLAGGVSPFGRYGAAFSNPNSPFASLSPFPSSRDLSALGPMGPVHDPWRRPHISSSLQRTVPGFPGPPAPSPWGLKPDPAVLERREQEEREREMREREQRERERARREREERDRQREREREREEKARKQQQLEQQERERERERERREKERRDMERREHERERLLQQQRLAESNKLAAAAARDRSPMRNGNVDEVRVKEEPRKDDDVIMLSRTDARYHPPHHPYMTAPRHTHGLPPPSPHSLLDRSRSMLPPTMGPLPPHFGGPGAGWPGDPYRDFRFDPLQQLRYSPLVEAAIRAEQEAKMYNAYAAHSAHMRSKEPSPVPPHHHRMPHQSMGPHKMMGVPPQMGHPSQLPPVTVSDLHKKEESSQAR